MTKKLALVIHKDIVDESKLKYDNLELISVQKFREFLYDFEGFKDLEKKAQLDDKSLILSYQKLEEAMLKGKKLLFSIFENNKFEGELFQNSLEELVEKYHYDLLKLKVSSVAVSDKYAHLGYFKDSYSRRDASCSVVLKQAISNEDLVILSNFLGGQTYE
ncbi:hypothetical protein L1O48_05295 [Ligilactobacillus equi]|uniref:hypothetical protein n=1 Tax=Ligilactobacillus equi TaxID=137357 RepID=UPI002ED49D8F